MELRHLRYFMAVGEELSFTRAAERLHIAQPPLSQQIKQLEEELGVTLLQRGARPLRLTGAGEVLLQRSRALLADLDAAIAETRRTGRGQTGKLSVGFAGSAMYVFLPDVINTFREACPNVELNLHEMLASEVAQALQERKIDVGFARPQLPPLDHIAQRLILEEPYLAALPKRHRLAGRTLIALSDLADEPFVLYPSTPGPSVMEIFTSACREVRIHASGRTGGEAPADGRQLSSCGRRRLACAAGCRRRAKATRRNIRAAVAARSDGASHTCLA